MLKCKKVVPIHWGTFKISGTGLTEPIKWLEKIIEEEKLETKISLLNLWRNNQILISINLEFV